MKKATVIGGLLLFGSHGKESNLQQNEWCDHPFALPD